MCRCSPSQGQASKGKSWRGAERGPREEGRFQLLLHRGDRTAEEEQGFLSRHLNAIYFRSSVSTAEALGIAAAACRPTAVTDWPSTGASPLADGPDPDL